MRSRAFFAPRLAAGIGLAGLVAAGLAFQVHAQQQSPRPTSGAAANPLDKSEDLLAKTKQDKNLKPHATPLTVTTPDKIPLDKLKVPDGFKVELWAHGIPGARMMTRGEKGTIFAGTRAIGKVYAVTDKGTERTSKVIAEGLKQPNGLAFKNGSLYVITVDKALRFDGIEDKLDAPEVTDISEQINLPESVHHNWKFAAIGPDNKLYIAIGSPCNLCEINTGMHGQIRRQNLDGSNIEIVARGVRNSVGFDWHPQTKELWFTDNGPDWIGNDGPEDELNRVAKDAEGAHYGFPYCHAQGIPDPTVKRPNPCLGVTLPAATMGPHAAALGMRFYTGSMFPAAYKNTALIARRGSWNREQKFGYDVVQAKINGAKATITPFMTGFLDKASNAFWGRPVDVQQLPDGSLLVSDEQNGAIYRISYGSAKTAGSK
jgi:glucose/arabinose dehydrogenase